MFTNRSKERYRGTHSFTTFVNLPGKMTKYVRLFVGHPLCNVLNPLGAAITDSSTRVAVRHFNKFKHSGRCHFVLQYFKILVK